MSYVRPMYKFCSTSVICLYWLYLRVIQYVGYCRIWESRCMFVRHCDISIARKHIKTSINMRLHLTRSAESACASQTGKDKKNARALYEQILYYLKTAKPFPLVKVNSFPGTCSKNWLQLIGENNNEYVRRQRRLAYTLRPNGKTVYSTLEELMHRDCSSHISKKKKKREKKKAKCTICYRVIKLYNNSSK